MEVARTKSKRRLSTGRERGHAIHRDTVSFKRQDTKIVNEGAIEVANHRLVCRDYIP